MMATGGGCGACSLVVNVMVKGGGQPDPLDSGSTSQLSIILVVSRQGYSHPINNGFLINLLILVWSNFAPLD